MGTLLVLVTSRKGKREQSLTSEHLWGRLTFGSQMLNHVVGQLCRAWLAGRKSLAIAPVGRPAFDCHDHGAPQSLAREIERRGVPRIANDVTGVFAVGLRQCANGGNSTFRR